MEAVMTQLEIRTSFDQKVRSGMFRSVTRRLHTDTAEDRSQEALALTYQNFKRHAEQGTILDDAVLVYSARQRAEDLGRQIVPCGGKARKTCVLDPRNFHEGKVEVLRLDRLVQDHCEADTVGLAEATVSNPVRRMVSAIDLQAWLTSLQEADQQLLSMKMAGHGLEAIGKRLGISTSAAWARCRELGFELADRAHVEVPGGSWEGN
jgi:hypothetical protein